MTGATRAKEGGPAGHTPGHTAGAGVPGAPSPTSSRSGSLARLLLEQVRSEFLQNARVAEFVVGVIAFPVMLYAMFGLPAASQTLPDGTNVAAFLMGSFAAYGVLGIAMFAFGVDIAVERGRGWLRLVHATPLPAWVYFAGKFAMATLFACLTILAVFAAAWAFGGVRLPLATWATAFGTLLAGGLAFSTIGFALGYWASPRGASPLANLVYLPLSFASGLFIPLQSLPAFLQDLAPYLPTYHFGQLVWRAIGTPADVALLAGPSAGVTVHVLWLAGSFALFAIVAMLGYRRDAERQYG